MKNLLVLFILFTFVAVSWSQSDYRDGYIIEQSGDTIYGTIDYRGDVYMTKFCSFMTMAGDKVDYEPDDIMGYRFSDG